MELQALFEKYLDDRMSPEELAELRQHLQREGSDAAMEAMIEAVLREDRYHAAGEIDHRAMIEAILGRKPVVSEEWGVGISEGGIEETAGHARNIGEMVNTGHVLPWWKSPWVRIAAALILLAGGVGGWLFYRNGGTHPTELAKMENGAQKDTAARGNIAFLTLGDGRTIQLDSAANGSLAQQGNVRVLKLDAGKLAYDGEGADVPLLVYNMISTPRGGQYQVILPDGSKAWLNAASSLRFPTRFPADQRVVEITGEAYFEVAKDKSRPFSVLAGGVRVLALGTSFNVNAYADEGTVRTTLLDGGVRVSNAAFQVDLKPGEQAILQNASQSVKRVNVGRETAWKNGYFQFENASIESIMRQLARWYSLDVHYEGKVSKRFLATIPRTAPIAQVLRVLEYTDAVHFKMAGNEIIVSGE